MKRRAVLIAGGVSILSWAAKSSAQAGGPKLIAVLMPGTQDAFRTRVDWLRSELAKLGYVDGRGIVFLERFGEDRTERLAEIASDLAAKRPAVIVTLSTAGVRACFEATKTIPIVFATMGAPVEEGFAKSLRRPGGNVTGILTPAEVVEKIVEIGREAMPKAQRFAILVHQPDPAHLTSLNRFRQAARKLQFDPIVVSVAAASELARAFEETLAKKADLLFPSNQVFSSSHLREIGERALKVKLPLLTSYVDFIATAGLAAYGTRREENYRRAAALVDQILRGANPGELPIERPSGWELAVNLKTARAIGVTLPQALLLRATRVIE